MTQPACLFCCRPIAPGERRCPALERGGVAAHQRCCGCQRWAGWTRPGQAPSAPVEEEAC
jgi:hypothetical protein